MEGAESLVKVHIASIPLNMQQRCEDCGALLHDNSRGWRGDFFNLHTDVEIDPESGTGILHDHKKNPNSVRCVQDFAPPNIEGEFHGQVDEPDLENLRKLFDSVTDKLLEDKKKDLSGDFRYEVILSVAKFRRDLKEPTGWKRIW